MNRRSLIIALVLIALGGGVAAVLWSTSEDARPEDDQPARTQQPASAPKVFRAHAPKIDQKPRIIVSPSGFAVRFSPGGEAPSEAVEATVGMAGIYPPPTMQAPEGGTIALPAPQASTLWGDEMHTYEIFARTADGSHAFWSELSTEGRAEGDVLDAKLLDASPLTVEVRDDKGEPVAGAEVRVSRGFVGLVHLTKETAEDGTATFEALPPGNLHVTLKKSGFARLMRRLSHGEGQETVSVDLERGPTRIGNGELERLAAQVVVEGNRTVVETNEPGENAESESDTLTEEPVQSAVDLYVVDSTGSAVSGALLQLWKGDRKLFEGTSRGTRPVPVELEAPFEGTLVAFDGRRGEGRARLSLTRVDTTKEAIVSLDRPLLSLDVPPGRINSRARIEQILGAELVPDGDAWLADVLSPTCAAAEAGIERGDRIVWVRSVGGGYSALVERGQERMQVLVGQ
ncbi:hypothetical protein FIV42_28095 [Persicimonas caeni]|uniref:Carboxypeptidase regulatory-like domain-containing protein n=1 Tax=Persicimonas caeni TaxID=2292766 RepID=A0A4Y6Q2R2_PERCE|nr:carboxypeptidase-like regulatory domain-containing protein [Persicimonas caeni]QDG54467.1 hypothetical protein FIV42_28095 [Persicimonas caeni]QED35688.1 hypothetical protein FRD00_28090 [Persicimonas caeni]